MKAILCPAYGAPEVLQLREVEKPVPRDNEVLIKLFAATVSAADYRIRSFTSPPLFWLPMRVILGIRRPRKPILGVELAGEIEAVGKQVRRLKPGDRVFGMTGMRFGAYAEYTCLPEKAVITIMPDNVSYDDAAAVPFGGTTAMHFFRKGRINSGQKVLIYGASGAVGTAAVQLAKYFGTEVTAVCSGSNVHWVKALGADHVIDYTKESITSGEKRYDLIFDAVGKLSRSAGKTMLAPGGSFVSVEGQGVAKELVEDLEFLIKLVKEGKYKPVIDRRYPLEQITEAHRYAEQGHKKGNVVITIRPS
ncbi:NAD(P)-dependent alcohol dehydrogenase [Paenibacillus tarimensis]